ncbi:hypothetical protein EON65_11325 [archaeon]|nr:MAG: hypothetical protein EON65_11325 [archaeon]
MLSGSAGSLVINTDLIPRVGISMGSGGYYNASQQGGVMMTSVDSNAYSNNGYQSVPQQSVVSVSTAYPQSQTANFATSPSVYPSCDTYAAPVGNSYAASDSRGTPSYPSSTPASTAYFALAPKKKMMLVLPPDVVSGSVLTVATPDGQMLRVTIETHHKPGQHIEVEY